MNHTDEGTPKRTLKVMGRCAHCGAPLLEEKIYKVLTEPYYLNGKWAVRKVNLCDGPLDRCVLNYVNKNLISAEIMPSAAEAEGRD